MQNIIYKEDEGEYFGTWSDAVSNFMYFESTKEILSKINIPSKVADYGGANGILKNFIPHSVSIDSDVSKNPDIVDNILTHKGSYDLIVLRYVLHYLNDYEVLELFNTLRAHNGKILIIQFCNEDLKSKYANSVNEFKYFRTEQQLLKLLPECKKIYTKEYLCTKEFYKHRLKINTDIEHFETLNAYYL